MKNKVYLLKDLARITGHSVHTVKFYLKLGLLREAGRSPETNYRYFNDATVASLRQIRLLQKDGRSLKEIKDELL